ncbi:hypothetical protein BD413DRAFT_684481 [Trametes elegans]|nr:hypothetical protein BD413DRAFT_684481 [Trametes elegans]
MADVYFKRPPAIMQEDVLYHLFEHVVNSHALAHAAVVCRTWTVPAQAALYRDIEYSPLDPRSRDTLLARTMRTRPHLLRFVRRVSLATVWTHSPTPELCKWIERIPEHRLQEFRWTWDRGHPLPTLLDSPAVRAARHIELNGRMYTMRTVQSILELPSLLSLSLELNGDEKGSLPAVIPTKLRKLSVIAKEGYSTALDSLLAIVGPQLESLSLTCKIGDDTDKDDALASSIVTRCPNLKRFEVEATAQPQGPVPFVDTLIRQCASLEYLRCTEGAFTPALYENLPASLKALSLTLGPTQEQPLLDFLTGAQKSHGSLTTLEVAGGSQPEQWSRVVDACAASGVVFQHRGVACR